MNVTIRNMITVRLSMWTPSGMARAAGRLGRLEAGGGDGLGPIAIEPPSVATVGPPSEIQSNRAVQARGPWGAGWVTSASGEAAWWWPAKAPSAWLKDTK